MITMFAADMPPHVCDSATISNKPTMPQICSCTSDKLLSFGQLQKLHMAQRDCCCIVEAIEYMTALQTSLFSVRSLSNNDGVVEVS